jgi:serine/threonine-protein kinase
MVDPDPGTTKTPGSWESLRELFAKVMMFEEAQREEYLIRAETDTFTRDEILRLLGYQHQAKRFFDDLSADIRPLMDPDPLLPNGTVLGGRFRIQRFIARGGMGDVYAAEDLELGGACALKTMRPGLALRDGSLARFREEIRLTREINSIHVCRVYDVGRHEEGCEPLVFLTMELLEGPTLLERIRSGGPLPLAEARPIIRQLALGLDAAHQHGVLHRDFKSSNVLLCGDRVVITDFGLSKRITEAASEDGFAIDGATPAYAAPEQITRGAELPETDVYSFGVVLYEMLTGALPYSDASTEMEALQRKLEKPPEEPGRLRAGLPAAWQKAILRCLRIEPAMRFRSAGEAARALGCDGSSTLTRRWWMAGAAGVCLAGAAGASWWRRISPDATPSLAVLPLDIDSADIRYLADGIGDRLTDTLAQLPGARIIARSAAQRYKGRPADFAEIGQRFRVHYLITGAVKRKGARLQITNEIVEAGTGLEIWSGTEELEQNQVERLNLTLTRAVIKALRLESRAAQAPGVEKPLTGRPEAYEAYLLGRFYAARRTRSALQESVSHFQRAVSLDPDFAAAWAALGYAWYDLSIRENVTWEPLMQKSLDAGRRALALDPALSEAFLVIGCNKRNWEWDFRGAEENFRKAVDASPASPVAHRWYANLMSLLGRSDEAIRHMDEALSLDPLSSDLHVTRATALVYAKRAGEALSEYESVLQSDPGYENVYIPMSDALEMAGRLPEAIRTCEKGVSLTNRASYALASLGRLYGYAGNRAGALAILNELEERFRMNDAFATDVAYIYLGLRDADKAFEWLERGIPRRDVNLLGLRVGPEYAALRTDPRYEALAQRIGL